MENYQIVREIARDLDDEPQKIAVVGLANVGKTCLLKTLFHQFDEIEILEPTHTIERSMSEFLHHPLSIWDFGGQNRYKHNYLGSPERYFLKIHQLFFVVDVQNSKTLEESIAYFQSVVEMVAKYSVQTQITVLYNKFDPIYPEQLQLSTNLETFKKEALKILKKHAFGYQGYKTSLYTPLLVMTAFSKSMLESPEIYDNVCNKLKHFGKKHQIDAAVVFTQQGFGLGYYISEKLEEYDMRDLFIKFFTKIEQMYDIMPVIQLDFQGLRIYSSRFYFLTRGTKIPLYFGFVYKSTLPDEAQIHQFITDLKSEINQMS